MAITGMVTDVPAKKTVIAARTPEPHPRAAPIPSTIQVTPPVPEAREAAYLINFFFSFLSGANTASAKQQAISTS